MKIFAILFFLMLMMTETIFAQTPTIEPGVSQTLARWRAAHYSDVRYKLNLTLEKQAPLMRGEIEIRVNLTEEGAKNDLILDWRTTQFANDKDKPFANLVAVNDATGAQPTGAQAARLPEREARTKTPQYQLTSNDTEASWRMLRVRASEPLALQSNEHLIIPSKYLKAGENVIKIEFASPIKTSGAAITRYVDKEDGAEYVYSLFVPSDASTAFPVFDQPDLKARFKLDVHVPNKNWKVISNGFGGMIGQDWSHTDEIYRFSETKPISTYVFAFAAGEFTKINEPDPNEPNRLPDYAFDSIYVRKSQAAKFQPHQKEVFRLNREGIKFLESYFDYKFPFPKYDIVLIPEFPFGGMEHAGATFLREASIIFPSEPTKNDYVSRANLIFHEAAHQWFGDTVTMKWFDDLWLKEGFAEFMAYKTLEKVMPEYNAWKAFYERNKPLAYLTDSTKGTTPIYQEIPNLSAAKSAYGNIVYRKAPAFLKQAEFYLGEKEFQTAARAFLKKHEYANAEWTDLVREFETASKRDLKEWADVWVKQKGVPSFRVGWSNDMGSRYQYNIRQRGFLNQSYWKQKFKILVKNGEKSSIIIHDFDEMPKYNLFEGVLNGEKFSEAVNSLYDNKNKELNDLIKGYPYPLIFPNYQDYGYGIFLLDEKSRDYVLKNIQTEKDDFLRSMMWGTLWDSVREAELDPKDYVELAIKNINIEQDESTIQAILSRVGTALNYYLSEPSAVADGLTPQSKRSNAKLKPPATADSSDLVSRLEAVLTERIGNAKTPGQRITFYRAYLNLASSAAAQKNLKDILAGRSKLAVFQLRTKDKFDLVTRLLILGDKDAPQLLANLEKTETSDDAKRYAYAARAGIASQDAKAKYFRAFLTDKNISESWIEAAFVPFNSSRHSDLTLPYLETALAELPNLKRTRKIFFVNGWLGAFIGGQKSAEALATVNKFLADNPNLDKDLRLKILENSDNLERAVKIRAKYGK